MDELDKWIKMRKEDPGGFKDFAKRTIEEITEVSNGNIESDLSLRLITPNCQLWGRGLEESPIPDPYWAFHWLGGQALTRYLIRHKKIIEDKTVLDFGCGGGALAITAAKLGTATSVTAIDIDPFAAVATEMNAELNGVDPKSIKIIIDDIVEQPLYKYDVIFVGDMLYDFRKSHEIMYWFVRSLKPGVQIFLGDPGRSPTVIEEFECNLKRVAKYEISKDEVKLNNLVGNVNSVWKFVKPIDYKEYFKGLFRICIA